MKILFLLLIAFIVWVALKNRGRHADGESRDERPVEAMVVCAHCGVHLPESESLVAQELRYCCRAHLDAGPARRNR